MSPRELRSRGLEGRVALITGAGGKIGRGIARCLAEEGMTLALADISLEAAEEGMREAKAMGAGGISLACDVTSEASCQAAVERVCDELGGLHTLVNNAGVIGGPGFKLGPPLSDISEADWDATYNVNVKGVFFMCRSAAPVLKAQKGGRVINISSRAGRYARPPIPHYSASKAAVISFTQALARELAEEAITVNAVCPGLIWSTMWETLGSLYREKDPSFAGLSPREVFDRFVAMTPLGMEQTPEDIGRVVAFLASDDARTITGQALLVDSGVVM